MTYDARETGVQTAEPVELYEFTVGDIVYRYTSAQEDETFGGELYAAVTMQRNQIEATSEIARGALVLTCANTLPVLERFKPVPPSEVVLATVKRFHRGDAEAVVLWMGRILNVGWSGLSAQIRCESVYSSIKRPGLRRNYQKQCPRVLFLCGVSRDDWKVEREVLSISGLGINLASMGAFADGYFDGGYVEWDGVGGLVERRAIRTNVGATVTVNFQTTGLQVGAMLTLYPGCDHTLGAGGCARYGNTPNYGGMPYIPSKNPFDGTPVF